MIISASRRTDIPAFYARWLINRLREGFCWVPNPFNPAQIAEISLRLVDVDAIVFWTRNPRPLLSYLDELDERAFRYYFQYTLLDYPRSIEPHTPPPLQALSTLRKLADRVGAARVIWRYDPILLSSATSPDYHIEKFSRIAETLRGYTERVVISFFDNYPKLHRRMKELAERGVRVRVESDPFEPEDLVCEQMQLAKQLAEIARQTNLEIVSCAEEINLLPSGIKPGKCIDPELIGRIFGLEMASVKDPNQRKACGCAISRDIGIYDTCLFGCQYCYANHTFGRSFENYRAHRPDSMVLK
jgi:DNA repair photolyase